MWFLFHGMMSNFSLLTVILKKKGTLEEVIEYLYGRDLEVPCLKVQ